MKEEEYIYFSRQFADMFGFPVRLYKNNEKIYYYSMLGLDVDTADIFCNIDIKSTDSMTYEIYDDKLYFGIVHFPPYHFVTGPVCELFLSEKEIKDFAQKAQMSAEQAKLFKGEMKAASGIHIDTLLQSLVIYNFTVSGKMTTISDVRIKNSEQKDISSEINEAEYEESLSYMYSNYSRVYGIEKDIISKIMKGDVAGLIDGANKVPSLTSGDLAPKLLRHHKNFFIKLETIAARAAINAGLDPEEVLWIEEQYIKKCEQLQNADRIKNLQYHMLLDYADRVSKMLKLNIGDSKLIGTVSKYIKKHISDPVKTSDMALELGKSRGGLTTLFKKQTGINLSDFIKAVKIQEAEKLLTGTKKSLVEISTYLGFSSQSHFCRVFKDVTGLTPSEYREKKKI